MSKTAFLNELAKEFSEEAKQIFGENWGTKDPIVYHMLMVTEIAEATEEVRKNKPAIYYGKDGKPEGEAVELADCLMRLLNYCGMRNLDISKALDVKRAYNLKRNWKSEGKSV